MSKPFQFLLMFFLFQYENARNLFQLMDDSSRTCIPHWAQLQYFFITPLPNCIFGIR